CEGLEDAEFVSQRTGMRAAVGIIIDAQLDVVPADRHFVHRGIESVPRREQGQHAAADDAGIGEDADPAALGETAGPAAYRRQANRKSTRLNSSHVKISYAVFCLKKKKQQK